MPRPALSPRERQVLQLRWDGMTLGEIAAHLGLSVRTVQLHSMSALRRLRVSNLPSAIREGLRRGDLQVAR